MCCCRKLRPEASQYLYLPSSCIISLVKRSEIAFMKI